VDTGLGWPSRSRQHAAFQGCRRLRGGVIGVQERMSEVVVRLVRQGTTAPLSSPPTVLIHGEVAAVLPRLRQCTRGLATDRAPCTCISYTRPVKAGVQGFLYLGGRQGRRLPGACQGVPRRAEACRQARSTLPAVLAG
jgi:hypothetical protein